MSQAPPPSRVDRVPRPAALEEPKISPIWESLATDPEELPTPDHPAIRQHMAGEWEKISIRGEDPIDDQGHVLPEKEQQYLQLEALDRAALKTLDKDPANETFLPGLTIDSALERTLLSMKVRAKKEMTVMSDPIWQQALEWQKANPDGQMVNMPQYFQEAIQQNAELGLRGSPQRELGRIFNALNQSYHSQVDPKGSVFDGKYTGPLMRRLFAGTIPHPFDDAPWTAKLGLEAVEAGQNLGRHTVDWMSSLGLNAFYTAAKVTRNLISPETPLPDWIENRYSAGLTELMAVIEHQKTGKIMEWDEDLQELTDRKKLKQRESESWSLLIAGGVGDMLGFAAVAGPVMGAAAARGAEYLPKGLALVLGAKNVPQYEKLYKVLGATLGASVFTGALEGISPKGTIKDDPQTGRKIREEHFAQSYLEGAAMAPIFLAAGAMGAKASKLLLQAKMPAFVAHEVGAALEGVGFGVGTQLDQAWELMKDPTQEKVDQYFSGLGLNAMVMATFRLMTRRTPMQIVRDRFLQETGMEPERWLKQAEAKEQTEQGRVQILRALSEGKAIEPSHEGLKMLLHPEEKAGIQEAARRLKEAVPQEQALEKVTGQATAQVGEKGLRGPENLLDRFVRWAQKRTATKTGEPYEGGPGGREMMIYAGVRHEGGAIDVAPARELKYDPKTGQPITMGVRTSVEAEAKAIGYEKGKPLPEASMAAMHNHPGGSFFSIPDLAVQQRLLEEYPPKGGTERVPFLVVGPNHVLSATIDPASRGADPKEVYRSYQEAWRKAHENPPEEALEILKARGMSKAGATGHLNRVWSGEATDPTVRPTLERAHLQMLTQWGKEFGYEFNVYTPNEARVLWRNYVETGKWKTDPSEVSWYRGPKVEGMERVFPKRPEPGAPGEAVKENIAQGKYTVSNLEQDTRTEHWSLGDVLQNLPEGARLGRWQDDVAPILSKEGEYLGDVSRARGEPPEPTLEAPMLSPTEQTQLQRRFDATMFRVIGETKTPEEALAQFRQQLASGDPAVRQRLIEEFTKTDWFERMADVTGQEFPETYQGLMESAKAAGIPLGIRGPHEEGMFHVEPFEPTTIEGVEAPFQKKPPLRGEFTPKGQKAAADEKFQALFHREEVIPRGPVMEAFGRIRGYFKELFAGQRKLFQDIRAARLAGAEAVEKAGYLWQFRKLGEFEKRFAAEKDRLEQELQMAPDVTRRRIGDALEPLLGIGKALPLKEGAAERKKALSNVLEHMFLKDFLAQAEKDPDTVLPLDLKRDEVEARLTNLKLSPEEQATAAGIRKMLDDAGQDLVRRGIYTEDQLRKDYMPHQVADWFSYFETFTPGSTVGRLRKAFRGYTMARMGSKRMIDTSIDSVFARLVKNSKDNAVHDYITRNGRAVHQSITDELQAAGIRTDFENMTPPEWKTARQDLDQQGVILYNAKPGKMGRHQLATDPIAQDIYAHFEAAHGEAAPNPIELGQNVRPNPEEMRFLVPKEVAEHWLDIRAPKKAGLSPTLDTIRRLVGAYIKAPMLRGVAGLATPARVARNLLADPLGIYFKKPLAETLSILKGAAPGGTASRLARAVAAPEWRKTNLTPQEEGLLQEMEQYGDVRSGETVEFRGQERWKTHPAMAKLYPELNTWMAKAKKLYTSDFGWVKSVEDYTENLFRASVWLHERTKMLQQGLDLDVAQQAAHLETARQLVNYKHLTPLESNVLNTLVFPFWTWTRHQATSLTAEAMRHPWSTAGKWALLNTSWVLWNQLMAGDEESKLIQSGNRVTNYPHVILPWVKDSNGNPMVVSWEGPMDMLARFVGLGGAPSQVGDYLFGHGKADILWHDLSSGVLGKSVIGQFGQDWMAPWIKFVAGRFGFESKYTTGSEILAATVKQGAQLSRPVSDIQRLLDTRKSLEQRATSMLPFFRYVEVGEGEPQEKRATGFYAGQQQRLAQKLSAEIHQYLSAFTHAMNQGNQEKAFGMVDTIWDHQADALAGTGLTRAHVLQRMIRAYEREKMREAYRSAPGEWGAKMFEISDQQRAMMLLRMWEGR